VFEATRWTVVLRARGDSPEAQAALGDLCEAYWDPVYFFLRREGRGDDESRELTQAFFARLLDRGGIGQVDPGKGRFRSYVLGALKHFLAEGRRNQGRLRRGGGATIESLDVVGSGTNPGPQIADPAPVMPEKHFDREWALTIIDRSLQAVQAGFVRSGKADRFEVLKPWLTMDDTAHPTQAEAAEALGLTLGAVKVAIHRLRRDFRSAVEAEIAQTVPHAGDVTEELQYLIEVLS
jgi:RNA polymerase sigma-70 factor (ECF subfamily)